VTADQEQEQERIRPKRGHREGSIKQLSNGRWQGRVMLGRRADGRPDRPWVYGKTRAEVVRKVAEARRQAEQGDRADTTKERQTVAQFMITWLAAARTSTRPQTWAGYERTVRLHIVPALGQVKLVTLRAERVQTLYADKLAEGLAPISVKKITEVLHRALEMAVKWNYIVRNPADGADRPAVPRRELPELGPAELNRLIESAAAEGDRDGVGSQQKRAARQWTALWTLAIHTGLREGELLALAWSDIDLDRRTLTVRRNLVRTHNQVPRFAEPKSQTSRRTIALPIAAIETLRAHRCRQAEDRRAAEAWVDYELVFCTHIGTPLLRRNVLRAFKLALERAGLPTSIHFHDLRHAHATLLLRAGVPIKTASARLGHSGITITGDLYQHVASDMDAQAAERAAAALAAVSAVG
jgi:integrase